MTSAFKRKVVSVGIATALMLSQGAAIGGSPDDTKSGAAWWQWALSIPSGVNPTLDADGANCMVGQNGDVWYLAGLFGASGTVAVTRDCDVPAGVTLFVPVFNFVNIDTPNVCGQGPDRISVKDLRAFAATQIDGATNLSVTVDGNNVKKIKRIKSEVFAATLPEDNLFDAPCVAYLGPVLGDVPGGVYAPAIDDGYYAQVNGLKPGAHVIQIHAENPSGGLTSLDVTYNLEVVAVPKH